MLFRNISTGETINVSNIKMLQGRIFFSVRGKGCGTKFFNRNVCVELDEHVPEGTFLKVADGWELADEPKKARKARAPKAAKVAEPTSEPTIEPAAEPIVVEPEPSEPVKLADPQQAWAAIEKKGNKAVKIAAMPKAQQDEIVEELRAAMSAKYGKMGAEMFDSLSVAVTMNWAKQQVEPATASVDEEQVRDICEEYFANVKMQPRVIEVHAPASTVTMTGTLPADFEEYVNIVNARKPMYMYGPAGCGKSYMAKKIAEALGLDYYETSQAMFAHELKGYGDAAGRFVETAFYRAFTNGGVFFLDEVDASAPEALVVLNNAIANGRFDFPVIGNVEAHPDFRVVAAGNTRMTGATLAYVARQMQDTSFKNRFFFELVGYDRSVFYDITGGDEEIVNFGADLRRAARETGIMQLFSYRQAIDLATLQKCCKSDARLLRGSVLQEKELDDTVNLYEHLQDKSNRWAKAMKDCIEEMRNEEVW